MSEPAWTGNLPHGWSCTSLGAIGNYWNGRGFKKSEWRPSGQGRPIVRIQDLTGTGSNPNYFDGEVDERHVARKGDLLVSWAASLGVFEWHGPEAVINQHIFKVESFVNPRWHRYLIESVLDQLRRQSHGSGMVHVTRGVFDSVPVLLPPEQEQGRIVEVVEKQFSHLEQCSRLVERTRRNLQRIRQAFLISAVSGDWPRKTVGEVASLCDGPFGSNLKTSHYVDVGPRVVRLQNIGEGYFRDEQAHITADHFESLAKHAVAPGDVVVASLGDNAPRACLIPTWLGPAIVKADCIRVRPMPDVDAPFLMFALNSEPIREQAANVIKGIGRPRLGLGGIRDLMIPVPPIEHQRRIVEELQKSISNIESLEGVVADIRHRSTRLRQAILQAAFSRTRLDGVDAVGVQPNEEAD